MRTSASEQESTAPSATVSSETRDLNGGLQSVTGKPLEAEFAGAIAASVPGRTPGFGVSYSAWGTVGLTPTYEDTFLSDVADDTRFASIGGAIDNAIGGAARLGLTF